MFTDESGNFDVTNPLPEINVKQALTNYLTSSAYAFGNQLSGSSSSTITFTIENLGSATLNLTGTPKVAVSGTNASEFTIDETATSATVAEVDQQPLQLLLAQPARAQKPPQ